MELLLILKELPSGINVGRQRTCLFPNRQVESVDGEMTRLGRFALDLKSYAREVGVLLRKGI